MKQDLIYHRPKGDVHYIDWGGDGPTAVIAHATGFNAGVYGPWAERLNKRLHVVGLDDRGHGRTTLPADPARLKDWSIFARDLEAFIEHLGGPIVAMGHSRGGVASVMLAARRPELFQALVLIDPTIMPPRFKWLGPLVKATGLVQRVPIVSRAARRQADWPDLDTIRQAWNGRGMFKTWTDGFLEAFLEDGVRVKPDGSATLSCPPAWESKCSAVFQHNPWPFLRKLNLPVLVLYGKESDTFMEPAVSMVQKTLPRAEMIGYEGASHFVPMEFPRRTASDVFDFLSGKNILT